MTGEPLSGTFGLIVRLRAKRSCSQELERLLRAVDECISALDGCVVHPVARAVERPDEFWITEVFVDRAAHAAAVARPYVRALAAQVPECLTEDPVRIETMPLSGHL